MKKRRGTSIPIPLSDSSIHRNVAAILVKGQLTETKEGGVGGSVAGVGDEEFGWSAGGGEGKVFFVPADNPATSYPAPPSLLAEASLVPEPTPSYPHPHLPAVAQQVQETDQYQIS